MSADRPAWLERPVEFGSRQALRGIVTNRSGLSEGPSETFLVLVNAGVIHRVGPNRLTVKIARELAPDYLPSLRFDFSGLGDSPPRTETRSIDESIALDLQEALAFLSEAYGAESFVVLGLCSGGREAFRAAYRDPRVRGAVMIDPYAYRTWTFYARLFVPRLIRPKSWRAAFSARSQYLEALRARFASSRGPRPPGPDLGICGLPERPSRAQMRAALDAVLDRGTELLFVHTAGMRAFYSYRGQFRDAFPKQFAHPALSYEYLPAADHAFRSEDARQELMRCLTGWFDQVGLRRRNPAPSTLPARLEQLDPQSFPPSAYP